MTSYAKMEHSLPSPPLDGQHKPHPTTTTSSTTTTKRHNTGAKPTKPAHRVTKRSSTTMSHSHIHSPIPSDSQSAHSMADARHKRVWKACERCRMKKTKVIRRFPPVLISLSVVVGPLTAASVTESFHVRGARTTASSAQQVQGRRLNLNNYLEGRPPALRPALGRRFDLHLCFADMLRS